MSAHAKLSPSAAKIWLACPGMPRLAATVQDTTSVFAEEGTAAHELGEACILGPGETRPAHDFIGKKFNDWEVTEEMADAVQHYLDYISDNTVSSDEMWVEERLHYNEDLWGTGDYVRYRPSTQHLLILDYKHGAGVFVDVFQNPQLLTYAVMAAKKLGNRGVRKITIAIAQPRCGNDPIREWHVDPLVLLDWEAEIVAAHEASIQDDPPLNPGPHCKWCKAAAICPALSGYAQDVAKDEFGEADMKDLTGLSDKLAKLPALETFIKAVRQAAYNEAMNGEKIPGYKLVNKQPRRSWKSEAEATKFLKNYGLDTEDIHTFKLKSPAQIDKVVGAAGKEDVADLWKKESSGLTLASADDKREEVIPGDAKNDFEQTN